MMFEKSVLEQMYISESEQSKKIHDIACDIKEKGIDKVIVMSGRKLIKQQEHGMLLKKH